MSVDVYVRVRCPNTRTFSGAIGHYDLYIDTVVNFRPLAGGVDYEIAYPVISYGNGMQGRVFIKNIEDVDSAVYGFKYYGWKFTIQDESKIDEQVAMLWATSESQSIELSGDTAFNRTIEYPPSNGFSDYSVEEYNCFAATAGWMSWLGVNDLVEIIENSEYTRYAPQLMALMLADANGWVKRN